MSNSRCHSDRLGSSLYRLFVAGSLQQIFDYREAGAAPLVPRNFLMTR